MEEMVFHPARLRCNGLENPLGIALEPIRLSWIIEGKGTNVMQRAYEIQVSTQKGDFSEAYLCHVQTENTSSNYQVSLIFSADEKREYWWRVKLELSVDGVSTPTTWSEVARFETGLAGERSWAAKWIEAGDDFYAVARESICGKEDAELRRPPYLSREWALDFVPDKARVYISARGLYTLHINGQRVGDLALAPDFSPYEKCIFYQAYDITALLHQGANSLTVVLGDGWFAGHAQGIPGRNHLYGERPALLLQLEAFGKTGIKYTLVSDTSFAASIGPIQYADFMMGERYETIYEKKPVRGFSTTEKQYPLTTLTAQQGEPVRETQALAPQKVWKEDAFTVVDFGQVIAGRPRLLLDGKAGETITIEHSEVLDKNGHFIDLMAQFPYHAQTNTIHFQSDESLLYEPSFSFQGFRYIRIGGLSRPVVESQLHAIVLGSDMRRTISWGSSSARLNQLISNIQWSQRGNMLSIPTDCPQRERAGFTGDAQIFAPTAAYIMDVSSFFRRWLGYCRMEQLPRGQIPIVVPYNKGYKNEEPNPGWTSAGWGDAIIFVPWAMYNAYGDITFLAENYAAMQKWLDYVSVCAAETMPEGRYMDFEHRPRQKYLWNAGHHWGDWLMPGVDAYSGVTLTKEITASLFYFRQVNVMARIARALGKEKDNQTYTQLAQNIREAFHQEYIESKKLTTEFQGLYVMALAFGMVEGDLKTAFAARLNELIVDNGYHLQTGFLSTPFLMDTLWDNEYADTAMQVLYQSTPPSWLYEVDRGATTMWEEWECVTPDGEIHGSSFNHYAFGSVGDFIFRKIGGIQRIEPGASHFLIEPEFTAGLTHAEIRYDSINGPVAVAWKKYNNTLTLRVTIPHGSTATIRYGTLNEQRGSGSYSFNLLMKE